MRVLGEIPSQPSPSLRAGTLRRRDLEAFNALLEELRGARTVLVSGDATGKRSAAIGLAAAAAAAGTRTVLTECDLADPALAEALGLAAAPGLFDYLRGNAGSARILKPVALAGPGSGAALEPLVCIVAGRPTPDGLALLESEAFRNAIAGLRDAYDFVVIEGPSAWEDDGSLAAVAAQADVTLICAGRSADVPNLAIPVTGLIVQT